MSTKAHRLARVCSSTGVFFGGCSVLEVFGLARGLPTSVAGCRRHRRPDCNVKTNNCERAPDLFHHSETSVTGLLRHVCCGSSPFVRSSSKTDACTRPPVRILAVHPTSAALCTWASGTAVATCSSARKLRRRDKLLHAEPLLEVCRAASPVWVAHNDLAILWDNEHAPSGGMERHVHVKT